VYREKKFFTIFLGAVATEISSACLIKAEVVTSAANTACGDSVEDTREDSEKSIDEAKVEQGEKETVEEEKEEDEHNVSSPDPYYPPIIYLPEVIVNSGGFSQCGKSV
jgi:hypothetical protein